MKKVLTLCMILLSLFILFGCSTSSTPQTENNSVTENKTNKENDNNNENKYIGKWSDVSEEKKSITVTITENSIEGTVDWWDGMHYPNKKTNFKSSCIEFNRNKGLLADIEYTTKNSPKDIVGKGQVSAHFKNEQRTLLEINFLNCGEQMKPQIFTMYKQYY